MSDDLSPDPGGPPPPSPKERAADVAELYRDYLRAREELLAAHPEAVRVLDGEVRLIEVMRELATNGSRPGAHPTAAAGPNGERLGRYVLREFLGRGSSAEVHRAYDPETRRDVALKVFHGDNPTADAAERFRRDARIAAHLDHLNIVAVYEAGEDGGRQYIAMRLVRGETLEQRLGREPRLTFRESAELVRKLAAALDYAHAQGVVHRDVKPSNVLLDEKGEPLLADFGLARHAGGDGTLTETGQVLGTPAYMSPEQAGGNARGADGRSDVYSLGVVLYRLLTGRLPFPDAKSFTDHLYHVIHTDTPALRRVNPDVPRDLETICLRAMAKEPAERFATAGAFAEELRRWLNDESLTIRPPTIWEKARRWRKRNRRLGRVIAVASVMVIVAGMVALEGNRRATEQEQLRNLETKLRAETETRAAEVEVRSRLIAAWRRLNVPRAGRRLEVQATLKGTKAYRRQILDDTVKQQLDLEIRSAYAATLAVPDLRVDPAEIASFPEAFHQGRQVALQPDGQAMAVGTLPNPVRWVRGQPLRLPPDLKATEPSPRLAFSPDGRYLAFAPRTGGLELWDGEVRRIVKALEPRPPKGVASATLAVGFIPDQDVLWACRADGQVRSWSLGDFTTRAAGQIASHQDLTAAAFSEAGGWAVGDRLGGVSLHEPGGELLREFPALACEVESLAWSREGGQVAVGTSDGNIRVLRADGQVMGRFLTHATGAANVVFSPDGRCLLAGGWGSHLKLWDVATGELLLEGAEAIVPFGFARDGRCLAAGGKRYVAFYDLLPPEGWRRLTGHSATVGRLAWSPDGLYLAALDTSFEVRTWDVERGVAVDTFPGPTGGFDAFNAAVAVSAGARRLAYASGGEAGATLVLRDPLRHREIKRCALPGGFERMACAGDRFVLVREERVPGGATEDGIDSWPTRSLVYEWSGDEPPGRFRELRPAEPGDVRRFLNSELTPDGRHYVWVGPRYPTRGRRAEVYEVDTSRRLLRVPRPTLGGSPETFAHIDPEGRSLWLTSKEALLLPDVADDSNSKHVPYNLVAVAPASRWLVCTFSDSATGVKALYLHAGRDETPWLQFINSDSEQVRPPAFSGDGRYLAWGTVSGTITVADLQLLRERVEAFEQFLRDE